MAFKVEYGCISVKEVELYESSWGEVEEATMASVVFKIIDAEESSFD
jgi:hypothetical protein